MRFSSFLSVSGFKFISQYDKDIGYAIPIKIANTVLYQIGFLMMTLYIYTHIVQTTKIKIYSA